MKKNKSRISPKSKYKAVLEVMSGHGTFEKIARKYNMSVSTLWNYNASADAAIRKVVGLNEDRISTHEATVQDCGDAGKVLSKDREENKGNSLYLNAENELVIRIRC
ncbi:hypothetical protein ACTVJH_10765 [Desulfoplanes sp. PS50]